MPHNRAIKINREAFNRMLENIGMTKVELSRRLGYRDNYISSAVNEGSISIQCFRLLSDNLNMDLNGIIIPPECDTNREEFKEALIMNDSDVKIMRINVNDICFDWSYQRKLHEDTVKKIVSHYDADKDRPVELSFRDSKYWCFDGQHRVEAHKILGLPYVNAQVHYGLSQKDEARLFATQYDGTAKVTTRECWNSSITAQEKMPEVKDIIDTCKSYGFTISDHAPSGKNKTFSCVGKLKNLYDDFGRYGILLVCKIINDAWSGEAKSTNQNFICAFGELMQTYGTAGLNWQRLTEKLGQSTPTSFIKSSKNERGHGHKQLAIHMVNEYNKGFRKAKDRLDPYKIRTW